MFIQDESNLFYEQRLHRKLTALRWQQLHLDPWILFLLLLLSSFGLVVLYSASDASIPTILRQLVSLGVGLFALLLCAQIPPQRYFQFAPGFYIITLALLIAVLVLGRFGHGAKRWLDLGGFHMQPSELMKLALPLFLARFLHQQATPLSAKTAGLSLCIILVPVLLIAKQPDLGTAILVAIAGGSVLFLGGLSRRWMISGLIVGVIGLPFLWHFMHDYQKLRVLNFLHPELDPLGSGYNIIQSKIAIGSGGLFGKGWLQGTQSHLRFLPAHTTDFIFAVNSEEFGLLGCLLLLGIFLGVFLRCGYLCLQMPSRSSRLLAGSLCLSFIICALINASMVMGLLPAVGVPLPLVSYGGTACVTILATLGVIMSLYTHRFLLGD